MKVDGRGQLARFIRPIRPGVIDIENYWDGRCRFGCYAFLCVLLTLAVYDHFRFGYIPHVVEYTLARDRVIEEAWIAFQAMDPIIKTTKAEYARGFDANMGGRLPGLVILITPLLLIFAALMIPRFHPVRVDGARGLIYSWRRGRLYILKAETDKPSSWRFNTRIVVDYMKRRGRTHFTPLEIKLEAADGSGKTIKPYLGTVPAMSQYMADAVMQAIEDVLADRGSDPHWVANLNNPERDITDPFRALFDFHLTGGGCMERAEAEVARLLNE